MAEDIWEMNERLGVAPIRGLEKPVPPGAAAKVEVDPRPKIYRRAFMEIPGNYRRVKLESERSGIPFLIEDVPEEFPEKGVVILPRNLSVEAYRQRTEQLRAAGRSWQFEPEAGR